MDNKGKNEIRELNAAVSEYQRNFSKETFAGGKKDKRQLS